MILTEFLVPIVYDAFPSNGNSVLNDEMFRIFGLRITNNRLLLRTAPCFITHANTFQSLNIPDDWTGCLYSSEAILGEMKSVLNKHKGIQTYPLEQNKPTSVNLPNGKSVEVTMISLRFLNKEVSMFLIKDSYINCLITACIGNFLDAVVYNPTLRDALRNGIDVLYIDDTILHHENVNDSVHPNKFELSALVRLVHPKEVIGKLGKPLPKYITEMCRSELDPFEDMSDDTTYQRSSG